MTLRERKEMFQKTFNIIAKGYDNDAMRFFPESAELLASHLPLEGDEHVLDVATGTGYAACALAGRLPRGHVTGIDFSDGMIARAGEKIAALGIGNVSIVKMDMESIEYADEYFDAAVCAFGIFFVDDMQSQLRHVSRKVKRGGEVAISTFFETTFLPLVEMFMDRLRHYGVEMPPMTWKRVSTRDSCLALFEDAGLENARVSRENISYYLSDAGQWWEVIWNAGYRGLVNQLAHDDMRRFKKEHLREVEKTATGKGIRLEVEVLITRGARP